MTFHAWTPTPSGDDWIRLGGGFFGAADIPLSDERKAIIARETAREDLRDTADREAAEADAKGRLWMEERQGVQRHSVAEFLAQMAETDRRRELAREGKPSREHDRSCGLHQLRKPDLRPLRRPGPSPEAATGAGATDHRGEAGRSGRQAGSGRHGRQRFDRRQSLAPPSLRAPATVPSFSPDGVGHPRWMDPPSRQGCLPGVYFW